MLKLLSYKNLVDIEIVEDYPWEFKPTPEKLEALRKLKREPRRKLLVTPGTDWNCYTGVRGVIPTARLSKENPPCGIRAFIADYDSPASLESITALIEAIPLDLRPTFMEQSLGGKWRAIWMFEVEILATDMDFVSRFFEKIAALLSAERLFAGYDPASTKPTQMWTNGALWYQVSDKPLTAAFLNGVAVDIIKRHHAGVSEVPMHLIAAEVEKRFPGRWVGDFVEGTAGVRFWDEKADNPRGAFVCKDGCYCLTGLQPFVSWGEIFGHSWVNEQRIIHLGQAASDVYFDGKQYWMEINGIWVHRSREDILLHLATRGFSRKQGKGNFSEAERVLEFIQSTNRVEAAVPVVYQPQGIIILNNSRLLNTSKVRPLEPAPGPVDFDKFPWIWNFINNHFARGEGNPVDSFHFWASEFQKSILGGRPVPGQAIFLCGPRHNGKTLLAARILKPLFGNVSSNPYNYLTGKTTFNADIFKAGFLMINDEEAVNDRNRELFNQALKSFVVNPIHMLHAKFQDRTEVEWSGRIFVTLNDDAKSVGILPELNQNTEDKFMFFASQPYNLVWLPKYELEAIIARELPYYCRFLVEYVAPLYAYDTDNIRCSQVKSYFDPIILELAKQQDSSFNLLELLQSWIQDGAYWMNSPSPSEWIGTPTELMGHLTSDTSNATALKDWTVSRLAKGLTALARFRTLVEEVPGKNRTFKIKLIKS